MLLQRRLRRQDLAGIRHAGPNKVDAEYWLAALDELESADLTIHEHHVLAGIRDGLAPGEERDLLERLLEMHTPRVP